RFHGDHWFGLFWGAFPFLTAAWAMGQPLGLAALAGAAACYALAMLQRSLSTPARMLRRRVAAVRGELILATGEAQPLERDTLLAAPEKALRFLCLAVPLLAAAILLARLAG
ncbi:MAG: hypothetical protein LC623_06935, partial [Halobacteriales archaeon]|nr:hypothetical protein [Halobacteriales archaeon]